MSGRKLVNKDIRCHLTSVVFIDKLMKARCKILQSVIWLAITFGLNASIDSCNYLFACKKNVVDHVVAETKMLISWFSREVNVRATVVKVSTREAVDNIVATSATSTTYHKQKVAYNTWLYI